MNREIPLTQVRPGDIILCKSGGLLATTLGTLIAVFDSDWRHLKWKPWHVRFVSRYYGTSSIVCESTADGIQENPLTSIPLERQKAYRWFDHTLDIDWLDDWVQAHLGLPYDVMVYPWTAIQYLARAVWNRRIPRLLDDRYTCWENVAEMAEDACKPLHSKRDCPMITDLCRALGILPIGYITTTKLSVVRERH